MSKQLSILAAGAPAALLQAAASLVSKASAGALTPAPVGSTPNTTNTTTNINIPTPGVVVGHETPAGVHTAVTDVPSTPGVAAEAYAGVKAAVVRVVLPRVGPGRVQLRDALDVYAAAGISTEAEVAAATASFKRSAEVAIAKAKATGTTRVTLVFKQATRYNQINTLFKKVVTETVEAAGLSTEELGTATAANQLIMYPESLGVVILNDVPAAENIELAYAGIIGGACRTYHTVDGGKVSAGHSYKSVALAVAQELRALGMSKEATKVEAAAVKNPRAVVSAL